MSKLHEENIEKMDVESLIVDLLACGLGAIIILFFIFSVNILSGQDSNVKNKTKANSDNKDGNGMVSLVGDNSPDKPNRMGAVRIVEFSGLSRETIGWVKSLWQNHADSLFWDYDRSDWRKDSLFKTIETQLLVKDNAVSFVLMADAMRKLIFKTPNIQPPPSASAGKVLCRIYFIEGQSIKYQFNGVLTWPNMAGQEMEGISDHQFVITVGKASQNSIDRLVKVIK